VNSENPPIRDSKKKIMGGCLTIGFEKSIKRDQSRYEFIDYIENGYNLSYGQIYDFNISNLASNSPQSKHYIMGQGKKTPYEAISKYISGVVSNYADNNCREMPIYAIGGTHLPKKNYNPETIDFDQEELDLQYRITISGRKLVMDKGALKDLRLVVNGEVMVDGIHESFKKRFYKDIPHTGKFSIDLYDGRIKKFNYEVM